MKLPVVLACAAALAANGQEAAEPVEANPRLRNGNRIDFKYSSPFWKFDAYKPLDPKDAPMYFATPGGDLGLAQKDAEAQTIAEQVIINFAMYGTEIAPKFTEACQKIGGETMECISDLESFRPLYNSLDATYQPALAKFYDSDEAFGRERLTNSPMYIKLVAKMADLPFKAGDVVGLEEIIAGTGKTLEQLVADEQVYIVDFTVFSEAVEVSKDAVKEIPIGVFFIDGTSKAEGKLMPLAIKFTVTNKNVYSPKDNRLDWHLAKAVFDTLDTNLGAINHFMLNHFSLENICISASKNLPSDHPVYKVIDQSCRTNAGVIASGLKILLAPTTGQFDKYMYISTSSIRRKLLPQISKAYDFKKTYLETDLKSRGVYDLPNFLYRDDAGSLTASLGKFITAYVTPFYATTKVADDADLQAFLTDLSTGEPGTSGFLQGFPGPDEIKTPQDVADMVTQVVFLTTVSHHALNTFKAWHYEVAYPLRVGKIFKAAPKKKGSIPDEKTLVMDYLYQGPQNSTAAFNSLIGAESIPFGFYPFIEDQDLMVNGWFRVAENKDTSMAALDLHEELVALSDTIRARETITAKTLPEYAVLDPRNIPYFVFI